ncbi:MAG: FG-GAP repeat protein [Candidatus Thiodiazotropha sp. (ex Dulcina madagascariensis)]|nr:FG-GAP repeat protein [Candidatus Thiodiazotropha sp. (ex Dulcina madagascariensis)]
MITIWVMLFVFSHLTACGGDDGDRDDNDTTYTISGTVTGLTGTGLVLQNNAVDDLSITADGSFSFAIALADASAYEVTVATQPGGQICTVNNGSGTLAGAGVSNVLVSCSLVAVTPTVSATGPKLLHFAWTDVGADHYRLLKNPDGVSGYTQVGSDITGTRVDEEIAVHLTDWVNASYLVQACDEVGACVDSASMTITSLMLEVIGYLKAGDIETSNSPFHEQDRFGDSVALSGDGATLAVGATGEDSLATGIDSNPDEARGFMAGAVYLFVREGDGWRQQATIKASNTDSGDYFGSALSLSDEGDILAVGAPDEASATTGINGNQSDNSVPMAGAVYLYSRNGSSWSQQAYVKASTTVENNRFGREVSLSGSGDILGVNDRESVYLFRYDGTDWAQEAILKSPSAEKVDGFGESLQLSGDGSTLALGAPYGDLTGDSANSPGAVHVFVFDGDMWIEQATINASNADNADRFGVAVSLSWTGDALTVGASQEASATTGINGDSSDNSSEHAGAVYLFERQGNIWTETTYLKASNTDSDDFFGGHLALSGDGNTLLVSATGEDSIARGINGDQADNSARISAGAVYLFRRRNNSWFQQAYVKASNTDEGYEDDYCLVEGPLRPCWGSDYFSQSIGVSHDGSTLVVGAPGENSGDPANQEDNPALDAGAVNLY